VSLESATRWLVTVGVVLLVGTVVGQEAATVNNGEQTPTVNKSQLEVGATSKSEPGASVPKSADAAVTPPQSQPDNPIIESRKDKISYAFGVDLARDLKQQKNDLNVDLLMQALKDALAGKPLIMTDDEATATLKQLKAEQKQDYEHAKNMLSAKNSKAGEAFFAENAKKEGIVTLPSGLQYKVLKKGDGKTPVLDDHVLCNYRGTLLDGTEFDSSYKRNQPATLPVKGLIKGWSQALQLMPVGSKWQLFIPPQLGYGDRVVGGIAPNAMLIFEIELLSIQDKTQTASAAK
jgi:FKBP-type peptidyl-prolyl cis-trans isomerase FklB